MSYHTDKAHMTRRSFIKRSTAAGTGVALTGTGMASLLAACGGEQASGKVELQFWDMVWGPAEYVDTAKKVVERFNKEQSAIQVTYQSIPWNNWYQTYSTAIGSGTAPDISTGAGYQAVQFYDSGAILPIDDVIEEWKSAGKLDDFLPNTVDVLKYDGHYVALPWSIDIRVPYYRKDHFEQANVQPPTTWNELKATAQSLSGNGKYAWLTSSGNGGAHTLFTLMLNNGGGVFTKDKKVNLMGSERNKEAVQFFADLVKNNTVNPASSGYQSTDALKAFSRGDASILIEGPGLRSQLADDVKKQVMPLSPLAGQHGDKGTVYWVNNIMIYQQTQHPAEAKTFLKWWSENQKALWLEGHSNQLPARQSFTQDPFFKDDEVLNKIIEEWLPLGKTTGYAHPSIFPQLNAVEGDGVIQTLMQDLLQKKDPIESLQKAQSGLESIMNSAS